MTFKKFFILIALIFPLLGASQDKINMLNGKIISGELIEYDSTYLTISILKKDKKETRMLDRSRVFSVTDSTGNEQILYIRDSTIGNAEPVDFMKYFVIGEQDAYAGFKPHLTNVGGFAFGLGISLFDTYKKDGDFFNGFFKDEPSFLHLLSPFVYTLIASLPGITFDLSKLSNRSYLLEEPYREGFARVVKIKRRFGGLKFSLLGSATGLGLYFLANAIK